MAGHSIKPEARGLRFCHLANLEKAKDENVKFLPRLPATYEECRRTTFNGICAGKLIDLGDLNQSPATKKRPVVYYQCALSRKEREINRTASDF